MQTPFDKVYVLHLATRKDRLENIFKQFNSVNLPYEIWWTTKRPFSTKIALSTFNDTIRDSYYDKVQQRTFDVYGNVFNCTFEHYTIIKQAYERGMNNILICEDDINFIANEQTLEVFFNNIPADYSCAKFWGTATNYSVFDKKYLYYNKEFTDHYNNNIIFSTLCYALSRKGMEEFIHNVEQMFCAADMVFTKFDPKYFYISNMPLAMPMYFKSDIIN